MITSDTIVRGVTIKSKYHSRRRGTCIARTEPDRLYGCQELDKEEITAVNQNRHRSTIDPLSCRSTQLNIIPLTAISRILCKTV